MSFVVGALPMRKKGVLRGVFREISPLGLGSNLSQPTRSRLYASVPSKLKILSTLFENIFQFSTPMSPMIERVMFTKEQTFQKFIFIPCGRFCILACWHPHEVYREASSLAYALVFYFN